MNFILFLLLIQKFSLSDFCWSFDKQWIWDFFFFWVASSSYNSWFI